MTFSLITYLLFALWGIACLNHWYMLYKFCKKYGVGMFRLLDSISEGDKEEIKRSVSKLVLILLVIVLLIVLLILLKGAGVVFSGQ